MKRWIGGAARVAAVFAAAFAVTAFATRVVIARRGAAPPPALKQVESFNFDAGMRRFAGPLSAAAAAALAAPARDTALVMVIRGRDIVTCEDLGRQIRELHRAWGAEKTLVVLADTTAGVEAFLRAEHMARMVVRPLAPAAVMAGGGDVATPAALVVSGGEVLEGVSHTLRAPNARLRSFAQELAFLRRGEGHGAPAEGVIGAKE